MNYLIWFFAVFVSAQYFGQNKPSYKQFNFEVYKTPHFEIYHYSHSDSLIKAIAKQSETWYKYHQQILLDTFKTQNPIIIYANHADFQQTTAISGNIGVGTGGVTEGFKRRVVMPVSFSSEQTKHVLGHEMVHAFQYHILQKDNNLGLSSVQNIPLWMIEGMAEYMSVGNTDSHTALWMRDALIHHNFPDLKTLTLHMQYSPYRYGQAFWSYIAYKYGEQYIPTLFNETAQKGYEQAIAEVFMISSDSLSKDWKNTLETTLLSNINDSTFSICGDRIITKKNAGRYNLSPAVSPDGEKIIFLSERDLFDLDLFMADTKDGHIIKKIYTSTVSDEIDAINYMETAGTWSDDSKLFAFVAYLKGESALVIFDTEKNKIIDELIFDNIDAISYPAWSPNGESIVFSGLHEGISDLFLYQFKNKELSNITSDNACNLQPSWSSNGDLIFYVTDAPSPTQSRYLPDHYNIASIKVKSKEKQVYTTFDGARNVNPVISSHGTKVFFLSDRDGTRNLYCFNIKNQEIYQLTQYPTGITGITALSPALILVKDNLYYNMLWDGEFSILKADIQQIEKTAVKVSERNLLAGSARLVPYSKYPSLVENNIRTPQFKPEVDVDSFYTDKIKPKFKLDYIGNTSMGVMAGRFGTGMAGSIDARFSDILSEHVVYTGVSVNGEIYDFGGQIAYINQKRPIKIGTSISHIPYRSGYYEYISSSDNPDETQLVYMFRRTFVDKLSLFGYYSFNKAHRIELGISGANYSFRTERIDDINSYYVSSTQKKTLVDSPSPFALGIIDAAYVIDNSKFGLASPIEGKRIRFGYERYFSGVNMNTFLFDFRKYFFVKPYSIAFRFYHYGRYGKGSESEKLVDMYIGYPWYIRGYEANGIFGDETKDQNKISINQLIGSKIIVSNLELRIPFTGPRDYAMIKSGFLFSELALFYDAGFAWTDGTTPVLNLKTNTPNNRIPIMSTGLALRVNLLGAIIVEPFFAFPYYQGKIDTGNFGINILSGW